MRKKAGSSDKYENRSSHIESNATSLNVGDIKQRVADIINKPSKTFDATQLNSFQLTNAMNTFQIDNSSINQKVQN